MFLIEILLVHFIKSIMIKNKSEKMENEYMSMTLLN